MNIGVAFFVGAAVGFVGATLIARIVVKHYREDVDRWRSFYVQHNDKFSKNGRPYDNKTGQWMSPGGTA